MLSQGLINESLNKFAKEVIKQSRSNLTKGDKNVTKSLYDSLKYDLNVSKNSFSLSVFMEVYGDFQDKGVKGSNPALVNGEQKAPNSPYSFKDKFPPAEPIRQWIKARGLRYRDEKGRFKKGGEKTLTFLIQRSIFAQGIKPSLFFTKPFEGRFKKLPSELIEAYGLEVTEFLKFTRQ
jgi:hypothetical protein